MLLKHQLTCWWGKLEDDHKNISQNHNYQYFWWICWKTHLFYLLQSNLTKILNSNPEYYAFLWQWKFHIFIMLKFQNLGLPNLGFIQLSKYQPKHSYNGYDCQWYDHLCLLQTLFMQFGRNFEFFTDKDMVLSSSNLPRIQTTNLPQRIFLFADSRAFVIFIHSEW